MLLRSSGSEFQTLEAAKSSVPPGDDAGGGDSQMGVGGRSEDKRGWQHG